MIEAGAVSALVLTGLIRSSEEDIVTRKACCCAMYTLCSTGNIDELGDWRVVWSATCMMNLGLDFCIMALTILANLSAYPNGRHLISNKQTVEELVSFATSKSKIKIPRVGPPVRPAVLLTASSKFLKRLTASALVMHIKA